MLTCLKRFAIPSQCHHDCCDSSRPEQSFSSQSSDLPADVFTTWGNILCVIQNCGEEPPSWWKPWNWLGLSFSEFMRGRVDWTKPFDREEPSLVGFSVDILGPALNPRSEIGLYYRQSGMKIQISKEPEKSHLGTSEDNCLFDDSVFTIKLEIPRFFRIAWSVIVVWHC